MFCTASRIFASSLASSMALTVFHAALRPAMVPDISNMATPLVDGCVRASIVNPNGVATYTQEAA